MDEVIGRDGAFLINLALCPDINDNQIRIFG